jgi:hypothetical protein
VRSLLLVATFALTACGNLPSSEQMCDGGVAEFAKGANTDSNSIPTEPGLRIDEPSNALPFHGERHTSEHNRSKTFVFHADRHPRESN